MEFLGQLLRGEKKAMHREKIKTIKISDKKYITLKRVAKQVQNNQFYMTYLPDKPQLAGRVFLFNIVNTLDPEYFHKAQLEVETMRIAKATHEKDERMEICPEMEEVLNMYAEYTVDKKPSSQSLAMLKMGAKKR